MPIVSAILMELEDEAKRTQRVLERLPEDKLAWKPHPKSLSLGQLALHVASSQGNLAKVVTEDVHEFRMDPFPEPKNRKDILDAFAESTAQTKTILGKMDDASMMGVWQGQMNGKTLMSVPRAAFIRTVMLNHIYHHRGQLSVYLRLLNVAVPSIYGPSADENPFTATASA
jgi:uncharacterized damage-inducible protein DinB